MNTKFKIRLAIFGALILGLVVLMGLSNKDRGAGSKELGASKSESSVGVANYDFGVDGDTDELSDALEYIFGTDPKNPDTDNDGYKDGSEVVNGYDPSVAGQARLNERANATLSVQYFTWAFTAKKLTAPQLDEALLNEFFSENNLTNFTLPQPAATDIHTVAASTAAVQKYFEDLSIITLPQETKDYATLAADAFTGKSAATAQSIGQDVLKAREQFVALSVPPQAIELQKKYLASLTVLADLFKDISLSQKDPVRVALNERRGAWLVNELDKLETLKTQIVSQL